MRKQRICSIICMIIVLLCVLSIGLICLYPFQDRDLRIMIKDNIGSEYEVDIEAELISQITKMEEDIPCEYDEESEKIEIRIADKVVQNIAEIKILGDYDSITLGYINYWDFVNWIDWNSFPQGGEIIWNTSSVTIVCPQGVAFEMTERFAEELENYSTTRLLERTVDCGWSIVFFTVVLICIRSLFYKENNSNHGPIKDCKRFVRDIWDYKDYIIYSAKADLRAEVANSYLNRLWWLLQPFFNMLVYVIVFGNVLGGTIKYYGVFIFFALLLWDFFSKTINYSVQLVRCNREIITHIYVPKAVILTSNMVLNLNKLFFSLIVLVPLILINQVPIGLEVLYVLPVFAVMVVFSMGLGMILLHFGVYIDDLSYAVGILLSMLMFMSGIFYNTWTTLPQPMNTLMMCLNPIAIFVDSMRNALLYQQITNIPQLALWTICSIILLYLGVSLVNKNENAYVKVV